MANPKKPLPKNFWDVVEKHLPNYHSRQDVADNNDLDALNTLSPCDKGCAAELDRSNRKLYAEACEARERNKPLTLKQLKGKLFGVTPGALLLIQDTDGDFSLRVFSSLNGPHLYCGWSSQEGLNYTSDSSSTHIIHIADITVLKQA